MKTDLDDAFIGTCENCGRKSVKVRRVKAIGMFKERRGYFDICFKCFKPRRIWSVRNIVMETPMDTYKEDGEE